MREYAAASWQTCEKLHLLMLADEQPENEKQRMDPDHWYVPTSVSSCKISRQYCARFFFSSNHNNQFVTPVNLTRKKYVSKANLQKIAFVDVGR